VEPGWNYGRQLVTRKTLWELVKAIWKAPSDYALAVGWFGIIAWGAATACSYMVHGKLGIAFAWFALIYGLAAYVLLATYWK
jgi:hypothetical protein